MKNSTKVLCAIGGILLILSGLWSFFAPLKAFIALEYFSGAMLIITGALSVVGYFSERSNGTASGWALFDAIISIVCGLVFCFSKYSTGIFALTVSMMLGMWLMMLGISQCSKSMQLKKSGFGGWGFVTAIGVLSILCSVSVFVHPISAAVGTESFLMGFLFIVGGISLFSNCLVKSK